MNKPKTNFLVSVLSLILIKLHTRAAKVIGPLSYCTVLLIMAKSSHTPGPFRLRSYLDPGTGSFIIQLFLGVIFGGLFAVKIFWSSVRAFFAKLLSSKRKAGQQENEV